MSALNPIPADADVTLADITEADFVGYAAQTGVVVPASIIDSFFHGDAFTPVLTWTAGAIVGSQTIFGLYVTMQFGLSNSLIFFRRFAAPVTIAIAGETVVKQVNLLSDDSNVAAFAP